MCDRNRVLNLKCDHHRIYIVWPTYGGLVNREIYSAKLRRDGLKETGLEQYNINKPRVISDNFTTNTTSKSTIKNSVEKIHTKL